MNSMQAIEEHTKLFKKWTRRHKGKTFSLYQVRKLFHGVSDSDLELWFNTEKKLKQIDSKLVWTIL